MPSLAVVLGGVALAFVGRVAAIDECDVGSYHNVDEDECMYCMNAPLNAYYTANGNFTSECPYELCEVCSNGEFNKGCGYDNQNRDPPSICYSMAGYDDICSAGPKYCTVQPSTPTDYDDCSAYCEAQQLTCLASYTSDDGGCGDSLDDLTQGACSATMDDTTVCACHLDSCSADAHQTGILRCDYYVDIAGQCPSFDSTATEEQQLWTAQNCRVSCGGCVSGESFGSGECTSCTAIEDETAGVYYTTDGDRSDTCDVANCTQKCFVGEYNAGCGFDDFKEDTFSCALCKNTCGEGNYISEQCDGLGFSDTTECSECSGVCDIGYYIANTCDGTTTYDSTECVLCTAACNPGYYIEGDFCTGEGYESAAECVECTSECPLGEFPTGTCDGSGTSDEVECLDCFTYCDQSCTDCDCFEPCFTVTVLGGSGNWALNTFDAVGGGEENQAGFLESDDSGLGDTDEFNVVIGGHANTAGGTYTSITGGDANTAFGVGVTIGGGLSNTAAKLVDDLWSITVDNAVIGGGELNTANADYAVILGGEENVASAMYSAALAGTSNVASGSFGTVLGGEQNSVRGSWAGVGGGKLNKAWANYATTPGGYLGKASARFSVVMGGSKNTAKGRYSFAAGYQAVARKDYSAVFGFTGDTCQDNGAGTFNICADYVYINGYDVTDLLASASGSRTRRLSDGSDRHIGEDAEMRRLARDMGYTLEAPELEQELNENDEMLKKIDDKLEAASSALRSLERLMQPASLRSR
mmetsp:Transcript_20343/g.29837  ORF Transcript_20343/g.29837 Transcript_20343/m.29837 type:complete len:755 (+) Transcript_20343:176-2440(+)|eukprot:CAMPEP_0195518074 /NCGR_PEP_ID=MMETSP0794_2-20130614/12123_1 /TAXON_ID=515487 /ORGANISM="Stephanopyxis turris, Strain CCMP 815" /LENGTH=754 /DNA_ID=CAMNT_0040646981 /DNA_START=152 /DNA_END=2416 /DNA_ORIENTATION=+